MVNTLLNTLYVALGLYMVIAAGCGLLKFGSNGGEKIEYEEEVIK